MYIFNTFLKKYDRIAYEVINKMKCRFCDTELTENDKYCPHCGMKVEARPQSVSRVTDRVPVFEQRQANRNVVVWIVLICVLILLAVFKLTANPSSPKDDYYNSDSYTTHKPEKYDYKEINGDYILDKGNDVVVSNLNGGGYITDDGTSVYMVDDDGNIAKFDKNMSKNEVIYTGSCGDLQVHEGYLYFKDAYKNNYTFKMDLATKEVTTVLEEDAYYVRVYGQDIYYQSDQNGENIFHYNMSTNETVQINDEASYNLQQVGNLLYFSTADAIKAYDITTQEIKTVKQGRVINLVCQEDALYYIDGNSGFIYTMDLTGDTQVSTRLNREVSNNLIVDHDQIYYLNNSNEIINMKTNGLDNQVLSDEETGYSLQLQGEYLFIQSDDYYGDYEWYRMDLNGENGEYVYIQNIGSYI